MDFSHLTSKLQVSNTRTAKYALYQVEGEPSLTVAPATEANPTYYNALLKRSKATLRRSRAGGLSKAVLDEVRESDRALYANHVIRGWEGVKDSQGKLVEFSAEACLAFLRALPNWLFDELRNFCGDPNSFLGEEEMDGEEEGELAGK